MFARVYPRQAPSEVVRLAEWQTHDEFYPFAPGTKPKGLLWCPTVTELPFLLGGHLYMFKTGDDWRARQFWSEVIAYELSKLCGVYVPPAFIAVGPDNETTGCLLEIFFGYPDEPGEARLIHGADLLRRLVPNFDEKTGRPHTIARNVRICRSLGVPDHIENWGGLLVFDALIGNTDRHPENWGLLRYLENGNSRMAMAPLYDNGTSLGYNVQEAALAREATPERIERYVSRGTHHVQFDANDTRGGGHIALCKQFAEDFPEAKPTMRSILDFDPMAVEDILGWCSSFDVTPAFSKARADYVGRLLESRRQAILAILEG